MFVLKHSDCENDVMKYGSASQLEQWSNGCKKTTILKITPSLYSVGHAGELIRSLTKSYSQYHIAYRLIPVLWMSCVPLLRYLASITPSQLNVENLVNLVNWTRCGIAIIILCAKSIIMWTSKGRAIWHQMHVESLQTLPQWCLKRPVSSHS